MDRCGLTRACEYKSESLRVELRCRLCSLFDTTHSSSSTASPDGSARSYPSLVSRPYLVFVIYSVWNWGVKMLSAHCLALHVAALAVPALKAIHRSSRLESCAILMVNMASWKPRCQKPATLINIPECDHHIRTYVPTCTARIDPPIQRPCTIAFDNQSQLGFMIKFHLYLIWHLYSYKIPNIFMETPIC